MTPEFELKYLNPARPQDAYKVLSALSKKREKQLRWDLSVIAQKELKRANQFITEMQVENWIYGFSKSCPEAEIVVLSYFIEVPRGGVSVEDLYWADALTDEFVDSVTRNFITSSVMLKMIEFQMKVAELETENETLKQKIAGLPSGSSETSPSTDEASTPSSAIKTESPAPSVPESV